MQETVVVTLAQCFSICKPTARMDLGRNKIETDRKVCLDATVRRGLQVIKMLVFTLLLNGATGERQSFAGSH